MNGFVRKTIIFIVVMAVVGFAGWFGRKVYQKNTEHHLIAQARDYLAKRDMRNAGLSLERALQINPYNVDSCSLSADMLEMQGLPSALSWRIRATQLETNNVMYRFAWAETALRLNDLPSAIQALRGVDPKYRSTAAFHKLAGTVAWSSHAIGDAEKEFSEALKLEPTNQVVMLNLATVHLVSTNQATIDSARKYLESVAPTSPLYLTSMRYLTADALTHKSYDRALFFSREIVANTNSNFGDKIAHLKLLNEINKGDYESWKLRLEQEASQSPEKVLSLSRWMQTQDGAVSTLAWLQSLSPAMQTNLPVPLAITDCQIAQKKWNDVLAITEHQDWGDLNYYRMAVSSLASRGLNDDRRAQVQWEKALQLSTRRLDRLDRLNRMTSLWGWNTERKEVLDTAVTQFPKETWAGEQLIALLYASGETRSMAEVLEKLSAANPTDNHLKNNLASVLLLLKSDLDKAHRLASESYGVSPEDPFVDCTYAYSLALQSKSNEAVKVMGQLKAEYLKNPSIAAYYGVVEALTGHKEAAREPLKLAATAHLLPEEMELVRHTESQL